MQRTLTQHEPVLTRSGDEPLWYKDALIYELHVRAFCDSDGDGIGDFRGLASRLDYLRDLGVTALWLLPFYPSPLRDDGYDISDYTNVHRSYGTLADFRFFLREAHRRGLRVITELVINHTSDQHPWFQRARRAPAGSPQRNFYVWSETPERYREARIIFQDFESSNWSWDAVANAYYWHRFYSHQPDLNFENPEVHKAIFQVLDFWLGMGVDGLRLDAVPYLYEREGTNCENLLETHEALKSLRRHVGQKHRGKMLLAEANQWPEDAVAYFGDGDECHMAFHFPLMPRMFMAVRMEDRFPLVDILSQTPEIPETCQWALFLRNHDELTLEMVTDEERDYMYRVFATDPQARINLGIRRRLAPLLSNDRRKVELMNGLLLSLPGTPVIYYGDEIGMGDNIYLGDRNGVRTPMQWSNDRNAGFSRTNAQRLYLPVVIDPEYHYEAVNVEAQHNNPHSLLWWMRRLLGLRKRHQAFGRGTFEFLFSENRKVLAFIRRFQDEHLLVVANLSRFAQYVELDMAQYKGMVPVELFGQTEFPSIGDLPYLLTLGPHAFYWFELQPQRVPEVTVSVPAEEISVPVLSLRGPWDNVFRRETKAALENILPGYISTHRWFAAKARRIKSCQIVDAVPLSSDRGTAYITLVEVEYTEGDPQTYVLFLTSADGDHGAYLLKEIPHAVIARLAGSDGTEPRILYSALREPGFCSALLDAMARRRRFRGRQGEIQASTTKAFRTLRGGPEEPVEPHLASAEQSNSSIIYGNKFILKLFRKVEEGINPDLEIGAFLTENAGFPHIPHVAGSVEYKRGPNRSMTLAILQAFVANEGDAWHYTLDNLAHYFDHTAAQLPQQTDLPTTKDSPLDLIETDVPAFAQDLIGPYLESARLLGQRTAELHLTLTGNFTDPQFAPEPFSTLYQRSLYQSMRNLTTQVFQVLRRRAPHLPETMRSDALAVLNQENSCLRLFQSLTERKITALRSRIHGDYHLGQVLYTGKDFMIIDFEGEPARPITERRIKRSPLRDVAGMIRSFHYAAHTGLAVQIEAGMVNREDLARCEPWAEYWYLWTSSVFLRAYLQTAANTPYLPHSHGELAALLDAYLLEKAIYELGYELNNRPTWVRLPILGIQQLLQTSRRGVKT